MRIAHVGPNIAGLPWRLAAGQRALGHDAVVLSRLPNPYCFPADILLPSFKPRALCKTLRYLRRWEADVVHLHGGMWRMDVLHRLGAEVFAVHYHGTETRSGAGLGWRPVPDVTFYTPPDLRKWHRGGTWVPQPIDTEAMGRAPTTTNDEPVFAHFPTGDKGTDDITGMFVRAFGDASKLRIFRGISHEEAINVMKDVDIVIDQHTPLGIYGYVSVEAMALGKPALSTIDRGLYPADCPVVYPGVSKLIELARDAEYRKWLGERGREYVERVHDARKVAERTITAYKAKI